jgi:hypothetical protein
MAAQERPVEPSDVEGRWLAAFGSGRWTARSTGDRWAAYTEGESTDPFELVRETHADDEDDLPEAVRAAVALHGRGWLDTSGQLTRAGRAALVEWATAKHRPAG